MAHWKVQRLYVWVLILLVGVLAFRNQISMSNMKVVDDRIMQSPRGSEIVLPDDLHTNLNLSYNTYLSKFTQDTCTTTVPSVRYLARTSQNFTITPISTSTIWIQESIVLNWSDNPLANKIFSFTISNASDIPSNKSGTFPTVIDGHWEHNYPSANETREINNQEASYVLRTTIISMVLSQNSSELIKVGDLTAPTESYNGSTTVTNYQEG